MMNSKPKYLLLSLYFLILTGHASASIENIQNQTLQNQGLGNLHSQHISVIEQKIKTINTHIDMLAKTMGKHSQTASPVGSVSGVTPLVLEALVWAMYAKINYLQYEVLREHDGIYSTSYEQRIIDRSAEFDAANIIELLTACELVANKLTKKFVLPDSAPDIKTCEKDRSCEQTPAVNFYGAAMTDVLIINRKINQLLLQPLNPSSVYRQIAKATSYWLLFMHQRAPLRATIPEIDKFVPNKRPVDVFRRLLQVNNRLNSFAKHQGRQPFDITISDKFPDTHIVPGDVHDISTIVLYRVLYLTIKQGTIAEAADYPYPGIKFPSHVYQSISRLENGVIRMEKLLLGNDQQSDYLSTRLADTLSQRSH